MGKGCDFGVIRKKGIVAGDGEGENLIRREISKEEFVKMIVPGVPELSLKRNKRIFRLYPGRMV